MKPVSEIIETLDFLLEEMEEPVTERELEQEDLLIHNICCERNTIGDKAADLRWLADFYAKQAPDTPHIQTTHLGCTKFWSPCR